MFAHLFIIRLVLQLLPLGRDKMKLRISQRMFYYLDLPLTVRLVCSSVLCCILLLIHTSATSTAATPTTAAVTSGAQDERVLFISFHQWSNMSVLHCITPALHNMVSFVQLRG